MGSEWQTNSVLDSLGVERYQVRTETWQQEAELTALLEEAHNLY